MNLHHAGGGHSQGAIMGRGGGGGMPAADTPGAGTLSCLLTAAQPLPGSAAQPRTAQRCVAALPRWVTLRRHSRQEWKGCVQVVHGHQGRQRTGDVGILQEQVLACSPGGAGGVSTSPCTHQPWPWRHHCRQPVLCWLR